MWVEKYRPKKIEEMIGNEEARMKLFAWLKKWKVGGKAVILLGPPGTGKTTLVHLAAREAGMNIVELNASDSRTNEKLVQKIGEAISSTSLYDEERNLIFLDEVDGLSGRTDYGAIEYIKEAVKTTQNPMVMAANNPDAEQVEKLSEVSVVLQFKPPPPREMELYARNIIENEGLDLPDDVLARYVMNSRGDIRFLVNSLQTSLAKAELGSKDVSMSYVQALNSFFEASDAASAAEALRSSSIQPIEKVREIFRAVVNSTHMPPEARSASLEIVSRADMLMGKIMRTQEWRLLRYLDSMLANELSKTLMGMDVHHRQDTLPWSLQLRVWNDSKKTKELARRYAARTRTSIRSASTEDIPYLLLMCGDKKFRGELMRELDLDEGFEKFLSKEGARAVGGRRTA
jgi:replication factor C large subunit